ncbi:MAG: YggT family protein [Rhodoluna sp.]
MSSLTGLLGWLVDLFRFILIVRVIFDWIRAINPSFTPKGIVLIFAEVSYILTDWVVKPLSKLIKPIRIGQGYLDVSILVLFLGLGILRGL